MRPKATSMVIRTPVRPIPALKDKNEQVKNEAVWLFRLYSLELKSTKHVHTSPFY